MSGHYYSSPAWSSAPYVTYSYPQQLNNTYNTPYSVPSTYPVTSAHWSPSTGPATPSMSYPTSYTYGQADMVSWASATGHSGSLPSIHAPSPGIQMVSVAEFPKENGPSPASIMSPPRSRIDVTSVEDGPEGSDKADQPEPESDEGVQSVDDSIEEPDQSDDTDSTVGDQHSRLSSADTDDQLLPPPQSLLAPTPTARPPIPHRVDSTRRRTSQAMQRNSRKVSVCTDISDNNLSSVPSRTSSWVSKPRSARVLSYITPELGDISRQTSMTDVLPEEILSCEIDTDDITEVEVSHQEPAAQKTVKEVDDFGKTPAAQRVREWRNGMAEELSQQQQCPHSLPRSVSSVIEVEMGDEEDEETRILLQAMRRFSVSEDLRRQSSIDSALMDGEHLAMMNRLEEMVADNERNFRSKQDIRCQAQQIYFMHEAQAKERKNILHKAAKEFEEWQDIERKQRELDEMMLSRASRNR